MTGRSVYTRLLLEARSFWPRLAAIFAVSLLSTPLLLLTPVPLKIVVDSVIGTAHVPRLLDDVTPDAWTAGPDGILAVAAALVIGIALLLGAQALAMSLLTTHTAERMLRDFRARLFRHAQRLSLRYHDVHGSAESTYCVLYDAHALRHVGLEGVIPFITNAVTLVAVVTVTALISWQLALVAMAIAPALVFITRRHSRTSRKRWRRVKETDAAAQAVVQQAMSSLRVVKAFGAEEREERRLADVSGETLRLNVSAARSESLFNLCIGVVVAAGTAAVIFIGTRQVLAGVLTTGELLLVASYLGQIYGPLKSAGKQVASLQKSFASAERAFELLDTRWEVPESSHPVRIARAKGAVCFEHVSFRYRAGDEAGWALRDVTFDVEPGARVGIAGRTGAGKTTLVSLLLRLYDPVAGRILLDGIDLRDLRLRDLRDQFAVVLQEPILFSVSIGENIAYAKPHASQEEVEAAARAAGAASFIEALPEGYETVVGERGATLSGGERQRISLARAFLKDAPIVILDEPTSSVDLATEAMILEETEALLAGRTTFIIAHRETTLAACNRRFFLDQGVLVESTNAPAAQAQFREAPSR